MCHPEDTEVRTNQHSTRLMRSCLPLLLVRLLSMLLRKLTIGCAPCAAAATHGALETQLFEPLEVPGSRSSSRLRCDQSRRLRYYTTPWAKTPLAAFFIQPR